MIDRDQAPEGGDFDASRALATIINQSGFPKTIKGAIQKTVTRLFLGTVGHPAFKAARSALDEIEADSRVRMAVADQLGRDLATDRDFMELEKQRFVAEWKRKHSNIEAVAEKALHLAEANPDKFSEEEPTAEPSEDWMNAFTRAAEDASSEDLQERLAAILAGEARKPGTVSRATVRLVAEIEKETLKKFLEMCRGLIGNSIARKKEWGSGKAYLDLVEVEDSGLITGTSGMVSNVIEANEDGKGFYVGSRYSLVVDMQPKARKEISTVLLTRAGREIAALMADPQEPETLRDIVDNLDKSGVTNIWLGAWTDSPEGRFVGHDEVLWPK